MAARLFILLQVLELLQQHQTGHPQQWNMLLLLEVEVEVILIMDMVVVEEVLVDT